MRTVSSISAANPNRAATVATKSSPALATNLASSKTALTRSKLCDTRLTESASLGQGLNSA
jgi:hypothetical protein